MSISAQKSSSLWGSTGEPLGYRLEVYTTGLPMLCFKDRHASFFFKRNTLHWFIKLVAAKDQATGTTSRQRPHNYYRNKRAMVAGVVLLNPTSLFRDTAASIQLSWWTGVSTLFKGPALDATTVTCSLCRTDFSMWRVKLWEGAFWEGAKVQRHIKCACQYG